MLVSHESPICLLDESLTYNDYEYCLAHLYDENEQYRKFYQRVSKFENRDILTDNSIFELGTAFNPTKYAHIIEELNPTYYILPDVLEDVKGTIEGFEDFLCLGVNTSALKIGVVQGKTYDDIVTCYKYMSEKADYIAISFDYSYYLETGIGKTKLERYCNGRPRLIRNLIEDGIWNFQKPHHLLGNSLAREMLHYKHNPITNIRSVDTSNPVVAGIQLMKYVAQWGLNTKPSVKLCDLVDAELNVEQERLIRYNIQQYRLML